MTQYSDGYRVGRGHPPLATRWKKGQSGNLRGTKRNQPESTVAVIDRLLMQSMRLTVNGETRREPAAAAIVYRLLQKAMSGSVRASRALVKYQDFVRQNSDRKLEVTFIESGYTRAIASLGPRR